MEFVTLNANNQEEKLIQKWDSLVWAERFNTIGDFQLVTGDIDRFMDLLPEGKNVSLRESNIAMTVETHKIVREKRKGAKLQITGRSYESILDRRASIQSVVAALSEWLVVAKIPSDVAHYIIHQICVLGVCDVKDIFPGSKVQFPTPDDYLTSTGPNREFSVPRGNLLQTVIGFLQTEAREDTSTTPDSPTVVQHGIRAVRPNAAGTAIAIEIYTGTDRSDTVYFDATRQLLDDGTYLFSKVGSATDAYGIGPTSAFKITEGAVSPSGLDRRVVLLEDSSDSAEAIKAKTAQVLSDAHETALFNGTVNQDISPYIYGVDYGLGDIVKTVGDYGLDERTRVTEYIRTQDATGYKAAPTLSSIPEYL